MRGRALAAALLVVALALGRAAAAADPCPDVSSYPGFRCRVAQLNQQTLLDDAKLKKLARKLAIVANDGAGKCVDGKTGPARKKLRKARRLIAKVERELGRAATRTGLAAVHRRELAALARRVDALRRAAEARLARSDCPALIELHRPAPLEVVADEIYLFATLDRRTDAGSVSAAIHPAGRPGGAADVALAQRSRGTVWGRIPCPQAGDVTVRLRARDRQAVHTEEVTVRCGAAGDAVLGGDVEVLVEPDVRPGSLRIEPVRPLAGGRTYAVAVTTALRAGGRKRAIASPTFRTAARVSGQPTRGTVVHYTDDPDDPLNPWPDDRLRRPDGTITIPPGFTDRAVPADALFDGTRAFLAGLDALCEEHRGFSPSAAIVVHLEAEPSLKTATPAAIRVVEVLRPEDAATPAAIVDAFERERGLDRSEIAVAFAFTVEDLPEELDAIRAQIVARAAGTPPVVDLTPAPAPPDGRAFGVFRPGDPEFAAFFAGTPPADAGVVARGTFPSPDYRVGGRIPGTFLDGSETPPAPAIDVVIVRPPDPVPAGGFPVVILQHGFCGSNAFVTEGAELLAAGLAVAGISAPEHGLRGGCLDFFDFDDFNAFGNNFRQSTIDLLALVEAIRAGVDLDGAGGPDLDPDAIGYLGVSLGGVIGGTLAAIEPRIVASVLNVPGGRLAQFAGSTSSLAVPFLEGFAADAGLTTRTCNGAAGAAACATDAACAEGEQCLLTEEFAIMLEAALPDFQCQLDPGDPVTYARRIRIDPVGEGPRSVLVQEGIGDVVVTNPLTEALARSIGLAEQRPDSNAQGVAGLWRFPETEIPPECVDPPEPLPECEDLPPDGHAIFALPGVRTQAVTFLASGGTELIAPPEPPAEE